VYKKRKEGAVEGLMSAVWDMRWGWFSGARAWIPPHPERSTRPLHIQTNINNAQRHVARDNAELSSNMATALKILRCARRLESGFYKHCLYGFWFVFLGIWIPSESRKWVATFILLNQPYVTQWLLYLPSALTLETQNFEHKEYTIL
jgi:hypothetical protein